jgi:hypothetical protein
MDFDYPFGNFKLSRSENPNLNLVCRLVPDIVSISNEKEKV